MAKFHKLTRLERVELMVRPESALAVVHQAAFHRPCEGIVKAELNRPSGREAFFGPPVSHR